jgi:hypothetical protein
MATPVQIIRRKKVLKAYFSKRGWSMPKGFNMAPVAGTRYREAIRRLQKQEWPNVPTTGIADTRVLAVLFPPRKQTYGELALRVAKTQVGVKEHPPGSNRGPKVDEYQAVCGIQGQPWCACFVTWCLRQVDWKERGWNQAYVPSWVGTAHLAQHGLHTIGSSAVRAGDIVCFDWEDNGVADHIGFCAGVVRGGSFPTIEGNTSAGNNSNGGQVQERTRSLSDVACFIRVT